MNEFQRTRKRHEDDFVRTNWLHPVWPLERVYSSCTAHLLSPFCYSFDDYEIP